MSANDNKDSKTKLSMFSPENSFHIRHFLLNVEAHITRHASQIRLNFSIEVLSPINCSLNFALTISCFSSCSPREFHHLKIMVQIHILRHSIMYDMDMIQEILFEFIHISLSQTNNLIQILLLRERSQLLIPRSGIFTKVLFLSTP